MKRNVSTVLPLTPTQQPDSNLPAPLLPVAPSEATQIEPVLSNRTATNSLTSTAPQLNGSSIEIVRPTLVIVPELKNSPILSIHHSAPEKSHRSTSTSVVSDSAITDADAQFKLGERYYKGEGVDVDKVKAVECYKKAADQGHAVAQFNLALMYDEGEGVDVNKAKAFGWFQKAANQGHVDAQFKLAYVYDKGEGVEEDKAKAFEWYKKAAEQGHAVAQFNLANMYNEGEGVEEDEAKAFQWFQKAALQGDVDAQFNLAVMYDEGEGVEEDKAKAFEWYKKAALQGHVDAQEGLSDFYRDGVVVEKNLELAAYWYLQAYVQPIYDAPDIHQNNKELISFITDALKKHSEFQSIKKMTFSAEILDDEQIAGIASIIRANSCIKYLKIYCTTQPLHDDYTDALLKALSLNTQLTRLDFFTVIVSKEVTSQITVLLTQNKHIKELREYIEQHPFKQSTGFPVDLVNIMVDNLIVSSLKGGQTKEATVKAINEFLLSMEVV